DVDAPLGILAGARGRGEDLARPPVLERYPARGGGGGRGETGGGGKGGGGIVSRGGGVAIGVGRLGAPRAGPPPAVIS
ncbi:hypothetical protein CDA31_15830, partial [Klebsiella pneumoniae]